MYNLYAKFVKILEICKQFSENLVNDSGNVPRRGPVPRTIKHGTKAPQAAGKIHSDFERGFIRAEVIAFEDMKACGTMANAKAKGLVRSEGKEYVMKDGDIVNFLFNV